MSLDRLANNCATIPAHNGVTRNDSRCGAPKGVFRFLGQDLVTNAKPAVLHCKMRRSFWSWDRMYWPTGRAELSKNEEGPGFGRTVLVVAQFFHHVRVPALLLCSEERCRRVSVSSAKLTPAISRSVFLSSRSPPRGRCPGRG